MGTAPPPDAGGTTPPAPRQIPPVALAGIALLAAGALYGMYVGVMNIREQLGRRPATTQTAPPVQMAVPSAAAPTTQAATPQQQEEIAEFVPGEIIIKLRENATAPLSAFGDLGLERKNEPMPPREMLLQLRGLATLDAQAVGSRTEAALTRLRALSQIEWAERNYIFKPQGGSLPGRVPNDPRYAEQWQFRANGSAAGQVPGAINLEQQWMKGVGSRSVVVGLLDSGILPLHPQVSKSPNLIPGFDVIYDTLRSNDSDGPDSVAADPDRPCPKGKPGAGWHGSQMAGIIGVGRTNQNLGIAGVNWDVSVLPVRVLGCGGGTDANMALALRWAIGLPQPLPANPTPARVINMSFALARSCNGTPSLRDAIADAVASGVIIVVAAGNANRDASNYSPASCNDVITVAASDRRGMPARYSNWGKTIVIMAPGGDTARDDDRNGTADGIISFSDASNNHYALGNGTSQAAAHVSGVVALWLSQNPHWTRAHVRAALKANAIKAQCPRLCGDGLLNAFR